MNAPVPMTTGRLIGIGDMSELAGVSLRALRLYEAQGLIRARRDRLNARFYDSPSRDRVLLVVRLRQMGLSMREIRDLLVLHDVGQPILGQVRRRLMERVEQLERARTDLLELLATFDHGDPVGVRAAG